MKTVKIALLILTAWTFASATAQSLNKKSATYAQAKKAQAPVAKASTADVASKLNALTPGKPSILSTPLRKPATLDPNSAVEVRGQARTLSMMLVLKNGKDSINFIKVRKDYHPEILATDY